MRDAHGKLFETDVVVSDASTDLRSHCLGSMSILQRECSRTGKASKLMASSILTMIDGDVSVSGSLHQVSHVSLGCDAHSS